MTFLRELRERASASGARRVGFPEADEARTAEAIARLRREALVEPVAVGAADRLAALEDRVPGLEVADPGSLGLPAAGPETTASPLRAAAAMLAAGRLDGVVAGARTPTAEVVRAALDHVGTAEGVETVSSAFYVSGMAADPSGAEVLTFTDAGVVPEPTAPQLAEIAASASSARREVVGDTPRVAFLSYSTLGSAEGASVTRVREARALFGERRPDVPADGEMQADAALVPEVAERKAPGSEVAGRANVLVFPDLDAGNIGYKMVQRLGGAHALGPILQGLDRPMNDLSRGASVADIVHVACITALAAA